jgi:hypothetical protein
MGKFRRFNFGATWLFILLSVGATYMTTGFQWIGLALTLAGIAFLLYQFFGELKNLTLVIATGDDQNPYIAPSKELRASLVMICVVAVFVGYVFYSSFSSPPVVATEPSITEPSITQDHPVNSPNFTGDYSDNEFTINQGLQDRRIKKEDEFIREMRVVGPVAVRLNTVDGREPEFLQGQLYKLLIDSKWAVEAGGVFAEAVHWVNVSVAVRDKDNVPPAAIAFVNQLRSNGIESFLDLEENPDAFVLERNPVTKKADFIVRVGDQPPGNNK